MLTVHDLFDGIDHRVAAGAGGLGRTVRWVHISELEDPTPWLSGGELLLTTGIGLHDDPVGYLTRLAGHGLTGLAFGMHVSIDAVPPALLEEAERRGFPVIELPRELPFIAVTEKAAAHIVNEQYALLRHAIAAQEDLDRIVLSERGLDGIAGALADLVDGAAAVFDARGEVLAAHGHGADTLRPGAGRNGSSLVLPVAPDGAAPQAFLALRRGSGHLTELDRLIAGQATSTIALELLRRRVASDTERRLAGDVLASLLSGELEGAELRRRLAPFGLGERVAAVVLAPPAAATAAVEEALRQAGAGLVAGAGPLTCALITAPAEEPELFAHAEELRVRAGQAAGEPLPAGAGRATSAGEARRAFHEARCALEGSTLGGATEPRLATYRDLGSFQLLLSLQDDDALQLFVDSILGPIEQSEGSYGGELVRSLEVFIECNGQWEKAARRLYCHRHTLRYRIRRVEELTGRSLESARDRIDFWLALRGRELLS